MNNPRFSPEFLICESPVSEVYGNDFDRIYNVRSKLFEKEFITRAYASKMDIDAQGNIAIDVEWKDGIKREIREPFHFIKGGVLYALKLNKHRVTDSFALNHELFALDWTSCVILHFFDDEPYIFISSREEWMALCVPGQQNEELQVFLNVPNFRRMPARLVPAGGKDWLEQCLMYKRER